MRPWEPRQKFPSRSLCIQEQAELSKNFLCCSNPSAHRRLAVPILPSFALPRRVQVGRLGRDAAGWSGVETSLPGRLSDGSKSRSRRRLRRDDRRGPLSTRTWEELKQFAQLLKWAQEASDRGMAGVRAARSGVGFSAPRAGGGKLERQEEAGDVNFNSWPPERSPNFLVLSLL